jgi:hypothetical protein
MGMTSIGIGISIRSFTSGVKSDLPILTAARDTWMKDAKDLAEILVFVDCAPGEKQITVPAEFSSPKWKYVLPKIYWVCYSPQHPLTTAEEEVYAIKNNFDKFAAMYKELLTILPDKKWYMKIDSDTIIVPFNLKRLLLSLVPFIERDRALIVGDVGERRKGINHSKNENWLMYRASTNSIDSLFKRPGWISLEREFHGDMADHWLQATATGIQGGLILYSSQALETLVRSKCMSKVSAIPCSWEIKKNCINRPEDLVVGLCGHLLEALLIDCHFCMRNIIDVFAPVQWVKEGLRQQKFCPTPVSVHAVKNQSDYNAVYELLTKLNYSQSSEP